MTTLFWGETGRINCDRHKPYVGSDTWCSERWSRMTAADARDFERDAGQPASCETCNAIARRHAEGAHAIKPYDECALCAAVAS